MKNKLLWLICIVSSYTFGLAEAQCIKIKTAASIRDNGMFVAAIESVAVSMLHYVCYEEVGFCWYGWQRDILSKYPKPSEKSRDITKIYHYAIRHNFLHYKCLEMCYAGFLGKNKMKYTTENTSTLIRLYLLIDYYLDITNDLKNRSFDDQREIRNEARAYIREICSDMKYQKLISNNLYTELEKLLKNDFDIYGVAKKKLILYLPCISN